ncbi:MAG: LysR family transcriptional regulator substrate-binding protein [Nitrososphaerota archaeon]
MRALVAEGMGVAVVPRSVAEAPGRAVAVIHVPMIELTRTVVLAYRVDHCHSAAADACMTFLSETQTTAQGNEDPRGLF